MVDTLVRDVRFAMRTLAKAPTFTAAVVATIALAVGATTAIFAVVDAILLRPLPFPDSERAVMLCETNPSVGDWCGASPMNVADWARGSRALESAGVARTESFVAQSDSENYGVAGGIASPGFFQTLRLRPMLGRLIEERDMPAGANQVVLVTYAFWQRRLGGDRAMVGRSLTLDERPFTVIGVLPADAYVPGALGDVEAWKPLTASVDDVGVRSWRGFTAIGRRAAAVSAQELSAELNGIRAQLAAAYPDANKDWGLRIAGLRDQVVGDVRPTLWIFLGAAAVVLLIACANVASLLLVRAAGRSAEFAVRASLGAGRRRLVQQLLTESLVLSLAGGALGLLLASWATAAFVGVAPGSIPRLTEVTIDGRIVGFCVLLACVTAVIFGFAPAGRAWKTDLNSTLKGMRITAGADTGVRSAFVVVQLSLALMLVFGAGLLSRSFGRLLDWNPGFERTDLATVWMLPPASVGSPVTAMERVRSEVAGLPGVRSAALGSAGPLFGGGAETGGLVIEGRPPFAPSEVPTVHWFDIDPHYFQAIGIRVLRGRAFTDGDVRGAAPVGVINETLARRFFAGQNPIGRRVTVMDHASEIVGVVADVKPLRPDQPTPPQIYWPIEQYRRGAAYLIVRTTPGIGGVEKAIRARAAAVQPGIQLTPMVSLDERFAKNLVSPRFNVLLVATFALAALLLAAVGVYGVIAYTVATRVQELGIRVALGATPARLVSDVMRRGVVLALAGTVAGCAGALAIGRLLTSLLYGLAPGDPLTLATAALVLAAVSLVACWVPARRASRIDPVSALK